MKQAGLTLPDLKKTAPEKWTASFVITRNLAAVLRDLEELVMAYHTACLQEGRTEVRNQSALRADEALAETLEGDPVQGAQQLQ